jgi:hypothetical protein
MKHEDAHVPPADEGRLDPGVRRPEPERAEWQHLLRYGYAPGNYMNTCQRCGEVAHGVDKRARCCRPCAEARHAWEQPPCQQCGAMTADEAAAMCLGAAAGDDCHGNHLWPT